jgi:hypothetical protein
MNTQFIEASKTLVFSAVLFVWVVRYSNIVEEFRLYKYPDWLRDLVGIMKITFVVMLMKGDIILVKLGAGGIMFLMMAAIVTHLRVKNPIAKMLPSMALFALCAYIYLCTVA